MEQRNWHAGTTGKPLRLWAVLGLGILAAMLQGLREMRRDVGMY